MDRNKLADESAACKARKNENGTVHSGYKDDEDGCNQPYKSLDERPQKRGHA
jgi:hypothetical protein